MAEPTTSEKRAFILDHQLVQTGRYKVDINGTERIVLDGSKTKGETDEIIINLKHGGTVHFEFNNPVHFYSTTVSWEMFVKWAEEYTLSSIN